MTNKIKLVSSTLLVFLLGFFTSIPHAYAIPSSSPSLSVCSLPDVVQGTPGDDFLVGTNGDDVICGYGGNDEIDGQGGDDIIFGGDGLDEIYGGTGNDEIVGGIGNDDISAGEGDDEVWGEAGDDTLIGDIGADYIAGGTGSDNLYGSAGQDFVFGESGDDSLNGGTDADYLDGGLGKNVCVKQSEDTIQKCFFDNKGPQLLNISIDPNDATIDSTDSSRKLHFRFTIKDPGTGANYVTFWFINSSNYKYWLSDDPKVTDKKHYDDRIESSGYLQSAENCENQTTLISGICKVSGSPTFGVFEATVELPRNMAQDSYKLVYFASIDGVSNQTNWEAPTLVKKKLAVSFKQIGVNDRIPATISSFEIMGSRTVLSYVFAKVSFADVGNNGLGKIEAEFRLLKKSSQSFTVEGRSTRDDLLTTCPEDFESVQRSCLMNGTPESGTAIFKLTTTGRGTENGERFSKGLAKLNRISVSDRIGNKRNYTQLTKKVKADNIVYEAFGVDLDSDRSAPVFVSLKASRTQINTSTSSQSVTYKLIARDSGKGLDTQFSGLTIMRYWSDGSGNSVNFCKTTSTQALGQGKILFNINCEFPAHFASGTYHLEVNLYDKSSNGNMSSYDSTQLRELGFAYQLVNG